MIMDLGLSDIQRVSHALELLSLREITHAPHIAEKISEEEGCTTLLFASSYTLHDTPSRALKGQCPYHGDCIPRWTAMLKSRGLKMLFRESAALDVQRTVMWMAFASGFSSAWDSDDNTSEDGGSDEEDEDEDGFEQIGEEKMDIGKQNRLCLWWKGLKIKHGSRHA